MSSKAKMQQLFVAWCRSKGIRRPDRPEQLQALVFQFAAELHARTQHMARATDALREFGQDPPLIDAYNADTHVLRDKGGMIDIASEEHEDDDFTELTRERQESLEEAGGDDLAREVIYRDKVRARDDEVVPFSCTNPKSWDRGMLGGAYVVQPNVNTALAGTLVRAVHWPGDDREAMPVCITVMPQVLPGNPPTPGTGVFRPKMRVTWGCRGSQFQVDLDAGFGTQFTVGCSSCYVDVGLDIGSDTAIEMFASLSFWATNTSGPQTLTNYITNLGPGATSQQPRPQFAGSVINIDRSDATVQVTLSFRDANNNVITQRTFTSGNFIVTPIALPNDVRTVDVINNDNAKTINARLMWGMDIA